MKTKKKKGISRLLAIAGQRRGLMILACSLAAISAALMLVPFLSVYFILREMLQNGVGEANQAFYLRQGWIAFGALAAAFVTKYFSLMASHVAAYNILYGLRMNISRHLGALSLGYLSNTAIGTVKKTTEQNVEQIELFVAHKIPETVEALTTVIVLSGALLYLSPPLALTFLTAFFVAIGFQISRFFGDEARRVLRIYYDALDQVGSSAVQYVRGMQVVKVFGRTVESFRGFYRDIKTYGDFCLEYTKQFRVGYCILKMICSSFVTLMLPMGLLLLQRNPGSLSTTFIFLFFIVMAPGAAAPLTAMTTLLMMSNQIDEGVDRIEALMDQAVIPEPVTPKIPTRYDVEFRNVSFSYDSNDMSKLALTDLSFLAPEGAVTALVGPSGGGKSTVASLIPRFWDVQKGAVLVGGVDVRDIPVEKLMDIVSFVFQDNFLFFDTVMNNIRIGRPDATDEEVKAAAKAAQCHDFIESLPQGYDTPIGADGVYVSGGEEQRICIARAVLKNSPILVLDEATAFADPENEYEIQKALTELIKDKTVLVIAHRLSTIRKADQILVLQQGHLMEKGQHDELLSQNGLYARMWEAYIGAEAWKLTRKKEVGAQ